MRCSVCSWIKWSLWDFFSHDAHSSLSLHGHRRARWWTILLTELQLQAPASRGRASEAPRATLLGGQLLRAISAVGTNPTVAKLLRSFAFLKTCVSLLFLNVVCLYVHCVWFCVVILLAFLPWLKGIILAHVLWPFFACLCACACVCLYVCVYVHLCVHIYVYEACVGRCSGQFYSCSVPFVCSSCFEYFLLIF